MTLAECIARFEAAQPDPIVLTDRGRADVAARKLARAVAALPPAERLDALCLAVSLVGPHLRGSDPRTTA